MKWVLLWHPESPGMKIYVKACFLRRIGIIRSEFATMGELSRRLKKSRAYYGKG